jgi:hypothetical protein
LNTAKGVVLGRLYKNFMEAMNDSNTSEMDKIANRILRIGGTITGLRQSMSNRKVMVGKDKALPPEEIAAIEEAFNSPGALAPKTKK